MQKKELQAIIEHARSATQDGQVQGVRSVGAVQFALLETGDVFEHCSTYTQLCETHITTSSSC